MLTKKLLKTVRNNTYKTIVTFFFNVKTKSEHYD